MTKVLVIRFSSIGDIVLTSPVVRCLKKQLSDVEIHVLTKTQYVSLWTENPNISKIHTWGNDSTFTLQTLRKEQFDYVIDLHKNIRTKRVKWYLRKKSFSFPKLNFEKWVLVNFKRNLLPNIHIVDRYFKAVEPLGVFNDHEGLDFFINIDKNSFQKSFDIHSNYIVACIGGQFATKKLPIEKWVEILNDFPSTTVIIGGKEDAESGKKLVKLLPNQKIVNTCGNFSVQESAAIIKGGKVLITHDTGMMHIGAAFDIPIVSIWGNTVPEFGMYPYRPQAPNSYSIHEVKDLPCRPCSKIGYDKCPKGHFKCMLDQDTGAIRRQIEQFIQF